MSRNCSLRRSSGVSDRRAQWALSPVITTCPEPFDKLRTAPVEGHASASGVSLTLS
jgi:hypothetical protein